MKLYFGVVEDVAGDPLKLGRARVRVFGLHTDDKALIPVEQLPWAELMLPANTPYTQGLGTVTGLLNGSWVGVLFKDEPDCQMPIIIGTFGGTAPKIQSQETADEQFEFTESEQNQASNILKDSSGLPVLDSSGQPIKTGETAPIPATKFNQGELGSVSRTYESNGNPGAINSYQSGDDLGGASYGAYQFASYLSGPDTKTRDKITNAQIINSPVNQYVRSSKFKADFDGLSPATTQFDAKWKEIAKNNREEFLADQHKYIERNYYQVAASKCPTEITSRGKAIHEAIWSTSVQYGSPNKVASIFKESVGIPTDDVCDSAIVSKVYDYKISNVESDFKSSPKQWSALKARFAKEKADLLALAATYEDTSKCGGIKTKEVEKVVYKDDGQKEIIKETIAEPETPTPDKKGDRGFQVSNAGYKSTPTEADTNRLVRGVITGTTVEKKRNSIVSGKPAGDITISEPVTQFNTKYPHNKVFATPTGHIIEVDDTPGYERIHVYHRQGTFVEFYPDGKLVTKIKGSNTLVVQEDNNTIILANNNEHISGDENKTVVGNLTLKVEGNLTTKVSGDYTIACGGNFKVQAERIDLN